MTPIVYFAAPMRGDTAYKKTVQALVAYIQSIGYSVLTEHVAAEGTPDINLTAEQIERKDIAWLDTATHVIAEISGASTGVGREIEYARMKGSFGKTPAQILCLYNADREFYASPMIRGMDPDRYPNLAVRPYASVNEAQKVIKKFLG
ncbi:MAG: nucleoside 2-deoxyribosyltransferase [Patescibacteria group bacterium]